MLKYCQKSLNSCCFSSLASDFVSIKQIKATKDVSMCIEEPLKSEVGNHIDIKNAILIFLKGEQRVYYSLRKYKKMGSFDILTDISEHVTLVQLMDYLCNMNHAISVVGY